MSLSQWSQKRCTLTQSTIMPTVIIQGAVTSKMLEIIIYKEMLGILIVMEEIELLINLIFLMSKCNQINLKKSRSRKIRQTVIQILVKLMVTIACQNFLQSRNLISTSVRKQVGLVLPRRDSIWIQSREILSKMRETPQILNQSAHFHQLEQIQLFFLVDTTMR